MYIEGWTLFTPKDWRRYKEKSGCEVVAEDLKLWSLYGPDAVVKFKPRINNKTGKKCIYIETAYSMSDDRDITKAALKILTVIAKNFGADSIKMQTIRNPKIYERVFGMKVVKSETKYTMEIKL